MLQNGIDLDDLKPEADKRAVDGATPLYVAIDGKAAATLLAVSDPIKPGTKEALARLHEVGLKLAMVTGDNVRTAQALAEKLGIDHVTGRGSARWQGCRDHCTARPARHTCLCW